LFAVGRPGISIAPTITQRQEADVNTRRPGRDELDRLEPREPEAVVVASTVRPIEMRPHEPAKHAEERLSVFWRVFGGTILSIFALVAVTLYNNLQSNVTELRAELSRSNEARAELVKKEEFNTRIQSMWDRMQAMQELKATVTGLKEQVTVLGDKHGDLKGVRDQLATVEAKLKAAEDDHKAFNKAELTIGALEQKVVARDAQLKMADDERKEMGKQLAELRERLAKVEGVTEVKPMTKPATPTKGE
jgi:DNA repair exonuclease SbcCD ATPase subunit